MQRATVRRNYVRIWTGRDVRTLLGLGYVMLFPSPQDERTTYVVQAVLITLYLPVLLAIRFKKLPQKPWISRTVSAIERSTTTFLDAPLLFDIAMLFASLSDSASRVREASSATARISSSAFYTMQSLEEHCLTIAAVDYMPCFAWAVAGVLLVGTSVFIARSVFALFRGSPKS